MRLLTDEELFGMIPTTSGEHITGNADGQFHPTLQSAYGKAFENRIFFPESITSNYTQRTSDSYYDIQRKQARAEDHTARQTFTKAFPFVDSVIEHHLEDTNGYISRFPLANVPLYGSDHKVGGHQTFNYFEHAPLEYHPQPEERLKNVYKDIHKGHTGTFCGRLFWFLLATLVFVLVLMGGRIYTIFPEIRAWASEKDSNAYIQLGGILLLLEIVGCFVPASRLKIHFEDHVPVYLFTLGAIFLWGVGYFLGVNGEVPDSDFLKVLYHIIKWPVLIYYTVIWVFHGYHMFLALSIMRSYRQSLDYHRKRFVKIYEEDIGKLHRYLRLRKLWMAYAGIQRAPEWLRDLESRIDSYHLDYEQYKGLKDSE